MKSHVLLVALLCCTIDAFLITIGVSGVGQLIITIPHLLHITKYGGAIRHGGIIPLMMKPLKQYKFGPLLVFRGMQIHYFE